MNEHRRAIFEIARTIFYPVAHPQLLEPNFNSKFVYLFERETTKAYWIMAAEKKTRTGTVPANPKWEPILFVNRNLTNEEKTDHDARNEDVTKLAIEWVKLVFSGYTAKVSFDNYSKCYQATLTVWNSACGNFGYGLSARGSTPQRAISLLLYKHFEVLKEDWKGSYTPSVDSREG